MFESPLTSRQRGVVFSIVIGAFFLRLILSTQTLPLYDELNWMHIVDKVECRGLDFHIPCHGDQHPPGQVYWGALGTATFGRNLVGYRIGAALLGTLAVAAIAILAAELFGPRAGILAAFFLAVNEYHLDVSSRCTEKTYLAFAALALLATWRLVREPTTKRWFVLGLVLGLGTMTKQSLVLWFAPIFAAIAATRGLGAFRGRGPAVACAILAALLSVDLIWNITAKRSVGDPSNLGIAYQLSRLASGEWSWGPLALYIRPLYYHKVEGTISEYAAMTTAPGALLLAGDIASLFVLRSREARFLQALGFGTFLFFSIATDPHGEFWWSDGSLLPFVILAAGTFAWAARKFPAILAIPVLVFSVAAIRLLGDKDNYHPLDWGAPPALAVEQFRNSQRFLFVNGRKRDYVELTRFAGAVPLPARDRYIANLRAWDEELSAFERTGPGDRRARGIPDFVESSVAEERERVAREFERARGHD